jgi:hypothetical protein
VSKRKKAIRPVRKKTEQSPLFEKITFHKLDGLEIITAILCGWFLVYPKPYLFLLTVLLVIPILGLMINGLQGRPSIASLVEIKKERDGDEKYDVADFIDLPAMTIFVRVLLDYEFENFYSLIIPGTLASCMIVGLLFATHKFVGQTRFNKAWIYTSVIFNVCLYSYAGTYAANCAYDTSNPITYHTEVLDKHVSKSRRSTSYYVKVKPWGNHLESENIKVPYTQYNAIETGENIEIDLRKGLFGIPWYYIKSHLQDE